MKKLRFLIFTLVGLAVFGCGGSSTDIVPNPITPNPNTPIVPQPFTPIGRLATYLLSADRTGRIGVYTVDAVNGNLNAVAGSPFQTSYPLITLAVHPSGRFVYAGADDQPFLEGFSLTPSTGFLTRLPGFPISSLADGSPFFDSSGEFLYVVGDSDISGYRVNQESGALQPLPGFPLAVAGMQDATTFQLSDDDRFLFVPDRASDQVFVFSRNVDTGSMALVGQVPSGGDAPTGSGLTSDGRFLYIAHGDGTLTGFTVGANGSLTALANPATVYAAGPTLSFTFGFFNDVMFVGDAAGKSLNAFRVGTSGSLTQLAGYPRAGGGPGVLAYPFFFADLVYVADGAGNRINAYTVDDSGNLQTVPGTPITGSGSPTELEGAVVGY